MKISLKNAKVYTNDGFVTKSISICDNKVVPYTENAGFNIVDCSGYYVFPGFVDVHVHLREPGFSYKETVDSGTLSALAGGYTTVLTMPNLKPVPDSYENLKEQLDIIKRDARCKVVPFGSITVSEEGKELSDMEKMAEYVAGFSDDGKGVQSDAMMTDAMMKAAELGKIISAHCEDNSLLNGGVIHDGEFAARNGFKGISSESEYKQIERDIELARKTGVKYHVCHISTKESVELIRKAKQEGVNITCETAPHYLVMNDNDIEDHGRFKMNPPIRSEADRIALVDGVKDGTIDMIATDHAPHSEEEKSKGLNGSLMGVIGLESAFPVLYTELVMKNVISLEKLVELMSINPADRFNLKSDDVDFCVYDLSESYKISGEKSLSKGKFTPFEGKEVCGKCVMTICKGEIAYNCEN